MTLQTGDPAAVQTDHREPTNAPDQLTLVHASKAYPHAQWPDDHYCVMHEGKPVGAISPEAMSGTASRWWWEIVTREAQQRPANEIKGPAASRDEAMAAFRRAWDALR